MVLCYGEGHLRRVVGSTARSDGLAPCVLGLAIPSPPPAPAPFRPTGEAHLMRRAMKTMMATETPNLDTNAATCASLTCQWVHHTPSSAKGFHHIM